MCRKSFLDDIQAASESTEEVKGESNSQHEGDDDIIFNARNIDNSVSVQRQQLRDIIDVV